METDEARGVRSGGVYVRLHREQLLRGAAHGLAPALHALALPRDPAPATPKLETLRRRRLLLQERRRLVRQRHDAVHAAMTALVADDHASGVAVDSYGAVLDRLAQLYERHAMDGALRYYALLEDERAVVASWHRREEAQCQALVRAAKRRYDLALFGVHVESETSGQIRLRRLPEGDAQRARCVKAARENVKTGFFHDRSARIEVSDVYKIDNAPLLRAFERWVERHTSPPEAPKVKGLFCSVPTESLERCVVWGMFRDEHSLAASSGNSGEDDEEEGQPIFNRPDWRGESEAPGTKRRFVARTRVQEATPMAFPRRFSRYSTLNELRDTATSDLSTDDAPTRYLALCRVAMGKTQRITGSPSTVMPEFPNNASVATVLFSEEEEYAVRYPETVVPEFLVEYRFVQPRPVDSSSAISTERLIPVHLVGPQRDVLPSTAFEASVKMLLDKLALGQQARQSPTSLLTELTSIPPMFSRSPATVLNASATSHSHESLTTEKLLELCGRRRRVYVEDLQLLRERVWEAAKSAWDALDAPIRRDRNAQRSQQVNGASHGALPDSQRSESHEKPPQAVRKQSFKAKKLYSELALERQLQASDVARLDALVKSKLCLNGKLKKRDGATNKPRPFR